MKRYSDITLVDLLDVDQEIKPIIAQALILRDVLQNKIQYHPEYESRPIVSVGGGITSSLLVPLYCIEQNINPIYIYGAVDNDDQTLINAVEKKLGIDILRIDPAGNVRWSGFRGYDIWAVFFSLPFLGNSRVDACSKMLKREAIRKFMGIHNTNEIYLGIKAEEIDRRLTIFKRYKEIGVKAHMPLYDFPDYFGAIDEVEFCKEYLGYSPKSYAEGFPHNNCGDFCIKSGLKHLRRAYYYNHAKIRLYAKLEYWYNIFRGCDGDFTKYTIYRRVVNGVRVNVPLSVLLDEFDKEFENAMFDPYEEVPESSCIFCNG